MCLSVHAPGCCPVKLGLPRCPEQSELHLLPVLLHEGTCKASSAHLRYQIKQEPCNVVVQQMYVIMP